MAQCALLARSIVCVGIGSLAISWLGTSCFAPNRLINIFRGAKPIDLHVLNVGLVERSIRTPRLKDACLDTDLSSNTARSYLWSSSCLVVD